MHEINPETNIFYVILSKRPDIHIHNTNILSKREITGRRFTTKKSFLIGLTENNKTRYLFVKIFSKFIGCWKQRCFTREFGLGV